MRILAAFALVAIAFSHQPVDLRDRDSIDLAAYAMPDGSLPVICFGLDGPGNGKAAKPKGCEACRLTASTALPPPADTPQRRCERVETGIAVSAIRLAFGRAFPPAAPPTAPPFA
ncbi:MAG: hypothetical protein VYD64_02825 [Pseudomonadota bacterium]|nr:hypothetical protein [Pseudomonadota bacterium]